MKGLNHFKQVFPYLGLIICFSFLVEAREKEIESYKRDLNPKNETYQALEVVGKNPIDLIRIRGFKAELHYARTRDGYFIHVARIVNPLISPTTKLKRPVIFNHGLFETSTIWLLNARHVRPRPYAGPCNETPDDVDALNGTLYRNGPMMLANFGYDVWLMSMRGTDLSLHHDYLTPIDRKFWDYSLDDFALSDIPAVVDYVRSFTGAPKVGYIGHSQATFSIFGLLSTYPNYADVVEPIIAVAPVSYFHHTDSLARPLFLGTLASTTRSQNGPFPTEPTTIRTAIARICASRARVTSPQICQFVEALIAGMGEKFLKGFYSHLPYMTSLKVLRHFAILIKNKRYQHYDYGEKKNMKIYGSHKAPNYMIERIKSKSLCLISTRSDSLSKPEDVELFRRRLSVPLYRDIFIDGDFDHFNLCLDETAAGRLVNKPILEIFESFKDESEFCNGSSNDQSSSSAYISDESDYQESGDEDHYD